MEYIEVEAQTMGNDIQAMKEILQGAVSEISGMASEMEALSAMWTGAGHDAYMNQFSNDCERMNEVDQLFKDYMNRLTEAKNEYCKCEQDVSDIVRAINI
ncbi:MAG: WXG100 family type VII secretion target [Lachnospiraceae bacterium]|nr:WXG100 family type VII secretion target [Lachnospiraceae bacterium]